MEGGTERKKPLVLAVDDDRIERFLICQSLEQKGFRIITAENGEEAVDIFTREKPNIVLLDVEMPVMNGFEACRALRKLPWGELTPILMVTGLTDEVSIEQAYEAGATDFITKPLNWTILAQRVRYMLRTNCIFMENIALLEAMPDAMYRFDQRGVMAEAHPVSGERHPLFSIEDQGKVLDQMLPAHAAERLQTTLRSTLLSQTNMGLELHLERNDQSVEYEVRFTPINKTDAMAVVRDVTAFKRNERLNARFARVLEHASNEIYIFDSDNLKMLQTNSRASRNTGYEKEELLEMSPLALFPDIGPKEFDHLVKPLWERRYENIIIEGQHQRKDGSIYPVEILIHLSWDEAPPVFLAMVQDITERIKANERIRYLAYYDALTDLPNRSLFNENLRYALKLARRQKSQLAVLFIDIDRFKTINDTLGHTNGDKLLKILAERLTHSLRESDLFMRVNDDDRMINLARLGGDEFIIIINGVGVDTDPAVVAQRIQRAITQPCILDGHEVTVTPSIGIAVYPRDGEDMETLLKHADVAMYNAKKRGKNNFQFYRSQMNERALERLKLEAALRRALENDELVLHYQPQLYLRKDNMVGVEALVRWNHPERGLVPPGEFISLAEETGLILPMGEWVLRAACIQLREWRQSDLPPFAVSINLSALQFQQNLLAKTFRNILEETGVPADWLELELTESTLMCNADTTLQNLQTLKEMGFHLAIDDFGTGYSSLAYLKRFPLDTIKIDRSFVRDLTTNREDARIVHAIVSMARGLRLEVVIEGVETNEQLEFLRQHEKRCRIQGYLISRPLPSKELENFARKHMRNGKLVTP